jgi:hypothetical protein
MDGLSDESAVQNIIDVSLVLASKRCARRKYRQRLFAIGLGYCRELGAVECCLSANVDKINRPK